MSPTRFESLLAAARARGRAVGAFTCYDLWGAEAVLRAAEDRRAPAIMLVSPGSFAATGGPRLLRALRAMARESSADVLVQLDHATDPDLIARAADLGADAVMADGSKRPYADNLAFSATIVERLALVGVGVEAELGRVEGHEDRTGEAVLAGELTAPEEARAFREESDVACLAVAVGNVHGHYTGTPALDWERLGLIASADDRPLSLHGASGLPEADLRRAVGHGVAKVNVNTELRGAYFRALGTELAGRAGSLDLAGLGERVTEAVRDVVDEKLEAFGWGEGAP